MFRTFRPAALVLLLLGLVSLFALSGCGPQEETPPPQPPAPTIPQRPADRIELMPTSSGEHLRRHMYDENGTEIATEIQYLNGNKGLIHFRPDGTQLDYTLTGKDGKVRIERHFAANGTTVVNGFETRDDATMKIKVETIDGGVIKTTTYWFDGKRVFSEDLQKPDGSFETTSYHKNGTVWQKKFGPARDTVKVEEYYDKTGTIESRRERNGSSVEITRFRDGKPRTKQEFTEQVTSWGGVNRTLLSITEIASDGRITRKIILRKSGYNEVAETYNYKPDGTTLHRWMRSDGSIDREEVLDKNGKVISKKTYASDEIVKETVDYSLFYQPYDREPAGVWKMNEDYPYYRTQDD